MANIYSQVYLQFVFAVKNRSSLISNSWRTELYKCISGVTKNKCHKQLVLNGISNHLPLFVGFEISHTIPEFIKDAKVSSSIRINQNKMTYGKFAWQEGYGVFSYSHSQIDKVIRYINNQEIHHRKKTFSEEYRLFLERFNIPNDEKYILKDLTE